MPLFARQLEDLMADSLRELANNTNITRLSPGAKARALLEAMNARTAEQYDVFDLNMARAFVSTAPGQYLDLIGTLVGVSREPEVASKADSTMKVFRWYVATGTFSDINGGEDINIPSGTVVSSLPSGDGVVYRTTEAVIIPSGDTEFFFAAEASIPGEDSNIGKNLLKYHTFTGYTDYLNDSLLVNNQAELANGKNFEGDDNFRFRIANAVLAAEAANETAVRLAALSVAGVADVVIQKRYRGIGTFGVIIKSITPTVSATLISRVRQGVQAVMGLGAVDFVRGPREAGISLNMTVHYSKQLNEQKLTQIEDSIKDAITEYVNALDIGESLLVGRMVSELFGIDDAISNFGEETGKQIDELFIHRDSKLEDNKVREELLGDYVPVSDERIIMEPSVKEPIQFERKFVRR